MMHPRTWVSHQHDWNTRIKNTLLSPYGNWLTTVVHPWKDGYTGWHALFRDTTFHILLLININDPCSSNCKKLNLFAFESTELMRLTDINLFFPSNWPLSHSEFKILKSCRCVFFFVGCFLILKALSHLWPKCTWNQPLITDRIRDAYSVTALRPEVPSTGWYSSSQMIAPHTLLACGCDWGAAILTL